MRRFRLSQSIIILCIIFLLGTAVRFVGLGKNPIGMVDDEADAGYDAYTLLRTGKDQWGAPLPITSFRGFGDYRLPAYTYVIVPSVAVFGLTPFAVRLPAALFGSLTILLVYWLVGELFGWSNRSLPLLAAFFLAISPWHVGMSRIGLEETTSVFFVTSGLLALLKGRHRSVWIMVGCALFGISLYIYTANILLAPFLIAAVLFFFRHQYKGFKKNIFIGICVFLFVASPLLFSMGTSTATTRTRQVNFTNDAGTIDGVNEKQGACVSVLPRTVCRFVFNKYSAFTIKYISNYLNHFSPNLLSIYGTNTQYSILPGRGLLYVADYFLLVAGVIAVFTNPSPGGLLIIALLVFSAVPDSLTSDGQFARFFISYPCWSILAAYGAFWITKKFRWNVLLRWGIVGLFFIAFINFFVEYWTFFPYRYSSYSHFGYESLIGEIQHRMSSYDQVIVSSRVNDSKQYIYYLFYTKYDPALFQSGNGIEKTMEQNGWVRVGRINSLEFQSSLPGHNEVAQKHILLVGAPSEFPKVVPNVLPEVPLPVEFTVKDVAGHVLFQGVDSSKLFYETSSPV